MPFAHYINKPRNIDDFYYFLTVDKPDLLDDDEYEQTFAGPSYAAYASEVYYQHLRAKFDYIAMAGSIWPKKDGNIFNLSMQQKSALAVLALRGQNFLDVLKEINDQNTWLGVIDLPRVSYKFNEDDQSEMCLNLLATVNSLLSTNPQDPNYNQLITSLTAQTEEFKRLLAPTWFDRLQKAATLLVGAAIAVAGVHLFIGAAVGLFLAPSVMLLAIPGMGKFLAEVALSAALFYPVGKYGFSTMSKSIWFFSQASSITDYKNEILKPDTAQALTVVRGTLFENVRRDIERLNDDTGIKQHLSMRATV